MAEYRLQTLSLRLKPGALNHTFHNIRVPDAWRDEVVRLQAQRRVRDQSKTSAPSDNLNRVLRAVFPDLIAIGKNAWKEQGQDHWLLSDCPLPLRPLEVFVREWINEAFADISQARRAALLAELSTTPFESTPQTTNLADWTIGRNGTARYAGQSGIFHLLPHFIAAKFCRNNTPLIDWGDFNKRFLRVPTSGLYAQGAEIMSWPPERYEYKDRSGTTFTDYFSVVITFTVQTIPFDPCPVIHCDVGVRRWIGRRIWGFTDSCSVYFLASPPWLREAGDLSDSFTVAPMHRRHANSVSVDGPPVFQSVWGKQDVLMNILRRANIPVDFPTAQAVFDDPLLWLTSTSGINAAMVWASDSNYAGPSNLHGVGTGLPPLDRQKLWEWISAVTAPELEAAEPLGLIPPPRFVPALENPFLPSARGVSEQVALLADRGRSCEEEEGEAEEDDDASGTESLSIAREVQRQRCDLLKNAVGSDVEISLHYDSELIRAGVEAILSDLLGITPQTPLYSLPNGVKIHWNPIKKDGALYSSLSVSDDPSRRLQNSQLREAIERRRDAIKAALPPARIPAATLIELLDYRKSSTFQRITDPKTALRKGFAQTERLTQFLTPPASTLPENWQDKDVERSTSERSRVNAFRGRITNAVLDAFRQLGVQMPVTCRAKSTPLNQDEPKLTALHYTGYWLANHTRGGSRTGFGTCLPVFVRINGQTGEVTAQAQNVSNVNGAKTWMPYRELLLRLGRDEYQIMTVSNDKHRFFAYTKERVEELFGSDNVLFAHAQNCRDRVWPYIANTRMHLNRLGFQSNTTSEPMSYLRGLRVIRVRDQDSSETPQLFVCKVTDEGDTLVPSAGKGIYRLGENAFYIRTGRPHTMRVSARTSKLTRLPGRDGRMTRPEPGESTPHVRLLEVIPFGLQQGDDPLAWAALTLKLCEAATHFGGETTLPLPLHLAEQVEEYLHPLPSDEQEENAADELE